jgi:hypothetical protein
MSNGSVGGLVRVACRLLRVLGPRIGVLEDDLGLAMRVIATCGELFGEEVGTGFDAFFVRVVGHSLNLATLPVNVS